MKRHESRKISRNRLRVQALNPCSKYSHNAGINPFAYLFQSLLMGLESSPEEKKLQHEVKMRTEQKQAKARQMRKRNKV